MKSMSGKPTPKENVRKNSGGKGKSAAFNDVNPAFALASKKPAGYFKDPPVEEKGRVEVEHMGRKKKK